MFEFAILTCCTVPSTQVADVSGGVLVAVYALAAPVSLRMTVFCTSRLIAEAICELLVRSGVIPAAVRIAISSSWMALY
ncbi:hypothetical protein C6Q12_03865 [Burkholderia multivorans]|nr:hypothetical protein C6Q12_03865 [Burkholderia multivorans]